jgi:hypothetical protein
MARTRWWTLGVAVVAFLALFLLFGVMLPMLRYLQSERPALVTTSALLTQVQNLNDLVVVKYVVEKVVKLEGEPSLLGKDKVVLLMHAVVKAGVDLSRVRPEDVRVTGRRVELTLPPAQIVDCYVDDRKTEVWEHTTAFWRPFDKDLEQSARRQALDQIRLAAGEQGIQREASERARVELRQLLGSLGFREIEIRSR